MPGISSPWGEKIAPGDQLCLYGQAGWSNAFFGKFLQTSRPYILPSSHFSMLQKAKHQENGISTCVLFNLYTLCMKVLVTQLCLTLCNPMDCSLLLSMEFSRQEYWSGLPFPSPGIFPTWGLNLDLVHCSRFFTVWATRDAWSKYEFASQHLDSRNVTVLKLALNTPSPREWDVQYQVLWDSFPLTRMKWESLGVVHSSGIWERPPVFKNTVVPLLLSQPRWLVGEPLLPGDSHVPCPGTQPTLPLTLLRCCWRDDSPGGHTGTPSLGCQELCFRDTLCDWSHMRTAVAAETPPSFAFCDSHPQIHLRLSDSPSRLVTTHSSDQNHPQVKRNARR